MYEEWKGYLVRKGKTPRDCGFMLPGTTKGVLKNQENEKQIKLKEVIKKLSDATKGKDIEKKRRFLIDVLEVKDFKEIEELSEYGLRLILQKLKQRELEIDGKTNVPDSRNNKRILNGNDYR